MKRTTLTMMIALALTTTAVAANDWKDGAKDAWIDGKAETTLLLNGNLNSFDINTDVKDGAVTLTGKVENSVDKALAEELIENLDGVTGVNNQLTVTASGKHSSDKDNSGLTDAKIATVVKTRLLFESEVSGTAIDVDAKNGVVTLQGEVDSEAEKDLAVAIAKNTSDVNRVIDKLDVAQ
ncbi:MAG: BON domain-containing protein [Gammaproteobacteria bacterium]|nr:BON domain-containing protein [Gammaproteobacteria bacterium]MBU1554891.1 BON domain-containing protein [Gammaproteobacteria bacterium]MBU2069479.1 BON domain-containing protein [Gammaproteobacteria bacterium]MBU2182983.1 BON domain-containing protein [Gammaproteobacteria bacterium]MBU2203237.1 BON domain-containing protein [Gammaproteobacteria bacterium]